jgi:hypothetical protein
LSSCTLLNLEQVIQSSLFDGLQERRGDVHMSVEGVLSSSELGQGGDGGFQVGGVGCEVTKLSVQSSDATLTFETHRSHH